MPEEEQPVGKLRPVKSNVDSGDERPVGTLKPVGTIKAPLNDNYGGAVESPDKVEGTLDDIVKTSRRKISDGEKDMLRDMLSNPNLKPTQAKEAIQTIQGYHPKQQGNTITSPDYYVRTDKDGVTYPVPLSQGERPPKGYQVANVWGQTKKQGQDDSWYTDLGKSLFNALPALSMAAADVAQLGSLAITGEESKLLNRTKNFSESLKMFKDENGGKTLYNPDGIEKVSDLISKERFDFSPESLWNTVNYAAESLPQFLLGAGIAGRGVQGIKALAGISGELGAAGQKAAILAASSAIQLGDNMEAAKEAGLKGRDIAKYAGPISLIQGSIDAFTGLDISATLYKNSFKDASKNLVKNFAKVLEKDADGLITPEAFKKIGKEFAIEYSGLAKSYTKEVATDIGGEMAQESLQSLTEKAGQQIWDNITPEDKAKFGTNALSARNFGEYLSNGINSLGMAPLSLSTAKEKYKEQSADAYKIVSGGENKIKEFKANLDIAKEKGEITPEQHDQAITKINAYQKYNEQTKDLNLDDKQKKDAFELSFNIEALKKEIDIPKEDLDQLDPIAHAKIDSKKKLIHGLQEELNKLVLRKDVQSETKVGESTVQKVAKDIEPKEGTVSLKGLLRNKIFSTPTDKVTIPEEDVSQIKDYDVANTKSMNRNPPETFSTLSFNIMSENNPKRVKAIMGELLKYKPKNEMDVIIRSGKNRTITFDIGDNKQVKAASSENGKGDAFFKHQNLPEKRIEVKDKGGNTVLDEQGEPEFYYEEPAVMKRLDIPSKDKNGEPMNKGVVVIYNKKTGEFISYIREHRVGKSSYSEADKYHLQKIYNSNMNDKATMDKYAFKAKEAALKPAETKVKEVPVNYTRLAKRADSERELDAIIDQADKSGESVDFDVVARRREQLKKKEPKVKKPSLKLKEIKGKDLAKVVSIKKSYKGESVDVDSTVDNEQKKVIKKFEQLQKVLDCIHG